MTHERKRHPARGGAVQLGGERLHNSKKTEKTQPQARRFAVTVASGFWRGCIVSVEPATVTHQACSFRDHEAAIVFAEGLAQLEGWPIFDRTGGAE